MEETVICPYCETQVDAEKGRAKNVAADNGYVEGEIIFNCPGCGREFYL